MWGHILSKFVRQFLKNIYIVQGYIFRNRGWFVLVWFYGISNIVGYLMSNPFFFIYIKYIGFGLVCFCLVLWHIKQCWLFIVKSFFIFIYIKYIGFGLVWFGFMAYQTLLVNQCQIIFFIYIEYIGFGLVWFGLVLWHIKHCWLFNVKSLFLHIY